jgi:ABC-type multidrug transport system fused ATPase/permease subunit
LRVGGGCRQVVRRISSPIKLINRRLSDFPHCLDCQSPFRSTFSVFSYVGSDLVPKLGFLKACIELHRVLLHNVLRLPMAFFDVNPMGRLLARFSKDIDTVDGPLPRQIDGLIFFSFEVSSRCPDLFWLWRQESLTENLFLTKITHAAV